MKATLFFLFAILPALASAATCANPSQAGPNFSGPFTINAGTTLPVVWAPSTTAGCTTYFTTDGTTPTASSAVYSGQAIQLAKTTVILMIAQGPGMTASQQEGGQWTITVSGSTPPPPSGCVVPPAAGQTCGAGNSGPCVILSCTPSPSSGTKVSMFRTPAFPAPVTGLAPNCAYTDNAVTPGQTYSYYAEALLNGETSLPSNTCTVAIPAATLTTPTLTVAFSPAGITSDLPVSVTVTASGTPTPTGTVTLTSGAFSAPAVALVNGVATFNIAGNSLDVGAIAITAAYTPDTGSTTLYNSATGTGTITITPQSPSALTGSITQ